MSMVSNGLHSIRGVETMKTYNFKRCREFLDVDAKTFSKWLVKAKIDPKKQVNLADPRERYLTEEQIIMLADEHGRPRPIFPEEDEPEPADVTLASVNERLTAIEHLITQRFADLQHELTNLGQRISSSILGSQAKVKYLA